MSQFEQPGISQVQLRLPCMWRGIDQMVVVPFTDSFTDSFLAYIYDNLMVLGSTGGSCCPILGTCTICCTALLQVRTPFLVVTWLCHRDTVHSLACVPSGTTSVPYQLWCNRWHSIVAGVHSNWQFCLYHTRYRLSFKCSAKLGPGSSWKSENFENVNDH